MTPFINAPWRFTIYRYRATTSTTPAALGAAASSVACNLACSGRLCPSTASAGLPNSGSRLPLCDGYALGRGRIYRRLTPERRMPWAYSPPSRALRAFAGSHPLAFSATHTRALPFDAFCITTTDVFCVFAVASVSRLDMAIIDNSSCGSWTVCTLPRSVNTASIMPDYGHTINLMLQHHAHTHAARTHAACLRAYTRCATRHAPTIFAILRHET